MIFDGQNVSGSGYPIMVGTTVRTPTGRQAIVIELHLPEREATVQWIEDGERARFKWGVLR